MGKRGHGGRQPGPGGPLGGRPAHRAGAQTFDEMLTGRRCQQLSRNLGFETIDQRERLVRRFVAWTGALPLSWGIHRQRGRVAVRHRLGNVEHRPPDGQLIAVALFGLFAASSPLAGLRISVIVCIGLTVIIGAAATLVGSEPTPHDSLAMGTKP